MKGQEIKDKITSDIIASLEEGAVSGVWVKPWASALARNASTGAFYKGGNSFGLGIAASARFSSPWWATYKQWESLGAQVRKGERGTHCVKWVARVCKSHGADEMCNRCGDVFPSGFVVFNSAQVDGWAAPDVPTLSEEERVSAVEAWFAGVGATVVYGGDRACFSPFTDEIRIPNFEDFTDAVSFYGTLAHELVHWSGGAARLGRVFGKFGSDDYAREELVAELGASMLCSMLGLEERPREDHVLYLASWLRVLKAEPALLWAAASKASKAFDFLVEQAGEFVGAGVLVPVL